MISDTPRTDQMEQHAPVGIRRNSAFEQASDLCRQLERELNRACEMYRKLDIHALNLVDMIMRLERTGDAVEKKLGCGCGCYGLCKSCQSASDNWKKAKEAKP